MYDDIAILKKQKQKTYDAVGNAVIVYEDTQVYVQPRAVYRAEFYAAAQAGIQPTITFRLANRADYDDQKLVEYKGALYNVLRVDWNAQRDRVDLVCEKRVQ